MDEARAGTSGALVVLGEPGVGKTALLRDLTTFFDGGEPGEPSESSGFPRVLRTAGIESESPLPYAALYRLLRPVLDLDRLPGPQARALRVAFGLEDGPAVEPFLVGVATLSLLTEQAEPERPVVCVVDDAQWLDPASANALLFTARQLSADPVVMVFAARTGGSGGQDFSAHGLPVLELVGLDPADARRLLGENGGDPLPDEVADRLVGETRGNPLALLELPGELSQAQLHGSVPLPPQFALTAGVERAFLDRSRRLSEQVQTLLLVAAADATGLVGTVRRAAGDLGAQEGAWVDAERSGLLTVSGETVAVRHPLVRSAVYQAATSFERRQAHRALAHALDGHDEDRATWHRAAAVEGLDAGVADALSRVAARAEQRGAQRSAADAYERSAALTAREEQRSARLFAAARTAWSAGLAVRARALAAASRETASDPLLRADIDRLRARIEIYVGSAPDAHRIFTVAARAVCDHDEGRSLEMAVAAAMTRAYGGDSGATLPPEVLTRLLTPTGHGSARSACLRLLLGALTASGEGDWALATSTLARALEAGRELDDLDVLGNLGNAARHLGDDVGARFYYAAMVGAARELGAGMVVIYGLQRLAFALLPLGEWTGVRACADEALTLARSVGQPGLTAAPLAWLALLAALTGRGDVDARLAELDAVVARHPLGVMTDPVHDLTHWAKGTRAAAAGDAAAALHHFDAFRVPALQRLAAVDRIDAAARAGGRDRADGGTVADLRAFASASGLPSALADVAFARAVAATDAEAASEGFERALDHYGRASRPYARARAELAYGELLRRTNRRVDARAYLRSAMATFADLDAGPLLARAEQELRASGETARRRDPSTLLDLTPMERKVAELVGSGLSNKDVAAQCWVSPRTVAFHLRNVFTKLGITSRTELARVDFG